MSDHRLAELERAAVIDAVASAIRHDTRNELCTVRNAVHYIRRKVEKTGPYKTDPRIAGFFELIDEALGAVDHMLAERMGYQRSEVASVDSARLGDWVEPALRTALQVTDVATTLELDDRTAVSTSSEELVLVLHCLIDNAIEAMPAGGRLTIKTCEDADSVLLSVEDTGPGFTTESAHKGCDPFYTTKPGHVGLGLCLVKRIAARHGATVSIGGTQPGARVTVRFLKPAAPHT